MSEARRPVPLPDDASAEFWAACRRHELRMQRCAGCGHFRFPPRPMCPHCRSMQSEWVRMSGRGVVYSFVVCHAPVLPAFADRVPFPVVLVQLEEDLSLRLVGNLIEPPERALAIGQRVEVAFEEVTPEVTLPQWRLVS